METIYNIISLALRSSCSHHLHCAALQNMKIEEQPECVIFINNDISVNKALHNVNAFMLACPQCETGPAAAGRILAQLEKI